MFVASVAVRVRLVIKYPAAAELRSTCRRRAFGWTCIGLRHFQLIFAWMWGRWTVCRVLTYYQ